MAQESHSLPSVPKSLTAMNDPGAKTRKGIRFWLVLTSLLVSLFLAILENSAMGTALPTIVQDIHGNQFLWVLLVYGLTAAALVPLSGSFAEIFGRRPVMFLALFFFAAGSAIGGAAQSMNMLLAARAIQGAGGGSIYALTQIILSDIVTLQERGKFSGLFGFTWAIAGGIAPIVGGGLAKQTTWRWLFYLNIPIAGVAMFLILVVMKLPTPPGTFVEKVKKVDFIGQTLIMGSTAACVIALAWGGVTFPWKSAHVLVPLVVGLVGLVAFGVYEAFFCHNPIVPLKIISNRTSISGYLQIFLVVFIFTNYVYYLPVYYQACKDASPIASGVDVFPIAFTTAPISVIAGASVTATKHYRPQLWVGWALTTVGFGLLITIREDTARAVSIGYQILPGIGMGMVYYTTLFPVLAPLSVTYNAHALSLSMYLRSLSQVWGVALGGTILQNGLENKLPTSFTSVFNTDAGVAYSIIPQIPHLQQPLKDQVRAAFAQSLAGNWIMLLALSGLGLASTLMMKALPLHTDRDERWAMEGDKAPDPSSGTTSEKQADIDVNGA
ncbi:hypothetical protein CERSUDRAFT_119013 [Gelatoporia subvermispora B]|uniref:Major facilitator superfamily (MFS) profile domain-containing protein n=1 Tax=Ceriporiopsis subvermispora (strain B) TaxID=914234 RepID=M2R0B0_CERS8|nr:hypothetical protein CERSUDRAFT_119013 [Gelatoporia subvermispora B]